MNFNIIKLNEHYIERLVDAAKVFFAESDFKENGIECDTDTFRKLLHEYIYNPYVGAIIAVDEQDNVVGYILIYCQQDYTVQLIGDLYLFFVQPEWRGTKVGRSLVEAAVKQWKEWGCKRVYTEAASGIQEPQYLTMFKNLWAKFGFTEIGVVMKLEL